MLARTLVTVALLYISTAANAVPITLTYTGTGSGTLNGVSFADAAFTITGFGDTADRMTPSENVFGIVHSSATILLEGFGLIDFVSPTRTFSNNNFGTVGFSRFNGSSGADLYDGGSNVALDGWDMLTAMAQVALSFRLFQWEAGLSPAVDTSAGILFFEDQIGPGTFAATIDAAEPASMALVALCVGMLLLGSSTSRSVPKRSA